MTQGFDHVGLVVRDGARARRFYGELLGLPGDWLQWDEQPAAAQGRWGYGGVHHVALGTTDRDAQLKWKRRLQDAGVAVTGPYDRGWFHSIYFTDPDGQVLEIATHGPGYTLDEAADALGERVIVPSQQRLIGHRDEALIAALTHAEPVPTITPEMTLDGIHHITGLTGDVEEVGEFYERFLGLRLVKRTVNQDDGRTPHWFWAKYDGRTVAPHSALTMFGTWARGGVSGPRYRDGRAGAGQTHHVAFRTPDLGEARERLLSAGVAIEDSEHGIRLRAPDGLLLELTTGTGANT